MTDKPHRILLSLISLLCIIAFGIQALRSASAAGDRLSAAASSNDKTVGHALKHFSYSLRGEMMPRIWEITLREDGYYLQENDEARRPFSEALMAELMRAIDESGADGWQGVYETEFEVLDGEGFSLEMDFADGASVRAGGENAFPDGYFSFKSAVLDIFRQDKMAYLAGTYIYEGEGIGSDFTVTLNADGTYTFYEGVLSSYMGAGTWDVYFDIVYLTEGEGGFDLSFMFGAEKNALIYLADGSDEFVYVKVPDQGRFIRQPTIGIAP